MMTSNQEVARMLNPHYMELQCKINVKMHTILVTWVSDAMASFPLTSN